MLREIAKRLSEDGMARPEVSARTAVPPYHKVANDVIWIGFRIDVDAVRPFVPPELKLSEESVGIMGLYRAPIGRGLAPYDRGLLAVTVTGHDSSDASEGIFNLAGVMNEPAASIVRQQYSGAVVSGEARTWRDGDLVHGVARVDGKDWLRATIRPSTDIQTCMSGVDTFLGVTAAGLLRHADSYEADATTAELLSMEITPDAPPVMQAMQPREVLYAAFFPRVSSAWGEPRPIVREGAGDGLGFYLDLIEGTGRAAIVVSAEGAVLMANRSATQLLGPEAVRRGGNLPGPGAAALRAALARNRSPAGSRLSEPVVLTRQGSASILAHVLPFNRFGGGEGLQLVLLADAEAPERQDAAHMLQLLGLTQAEARLAAQIARGMGVRQAAEALSISEHTARSSLKCVYDKLGIGKQAELGHLVARLQYL